MKNIKSYILICIIALMIIALYIQNITINSQLEHYYTFFQPFHENGNDSISKLNRIISPYNKFIYNYTPLIIAHTRTHNTINFVSILSKLLLASTNILKINILHQETPLKVLNSLLTYKADIGIVPVPIIDMYNKNQKINNMNNDLQFIICAGDLYMFALTRMNTDIESLLDIQNSDRIGIELDSEPVWEGLFDEFNIDINKSSKKYIDSLITDLKDKKLDIVFFSDTFPSDNLNNIINQDYKDILRFISFDSINEVKFLAKFYYFSPSFIDLNKIPTKYLPVTLNGQTYDEFKPNLKVYKYQENIITTPRINNKVVYNITKTILENLHTIENSTSQVTGSTNKLSLTWTNYLLETNSGAMRYYIENGFVSETNNNNCSLLIGNMPCNDKTLRNHNLYN